MYTNAWNLEIRLELELQKHNFLFSINFNILTLDLLTCLLQESMCCHGSNLKDLLLLFFPRTLKK